MFALRIFNDTIMMIQGNLKDKEGNRMNRKLKQQLKLMNHTLNTIAKNQALIYLKLEELDKQVKELSTDQKESQIGSSNDCT